MQSVNSPQTRNRPSFLRLPACSTLQKASCKNPTKQPFPAGGSKHRAEHAALWWPRGFFFWGVESGVRGVGNWNPEAALKKKVENCAKWGIWCLSDCLPLFEISLYCLFENVCSARQIDSVPVWDALLKKGKTREKKLSSTRRSFSVFPLRPETNISVLTKNKRTKTFLASYELRGDNEKSVGVGGKHNEPNLFFFLSLWKKMN